MQKSTLGTTFSKSWSVLNNMDIKRDYNGEMLDIIKKANGTMPSLLLHSCCAPCSSSILERLAPHFRLTLLWFNPNIFPYEEFEKRLDAQRQLIDAMGLSSVVETRILPWQNERYMESIKGFENEPEKGKRCEICFRVRLDETAKIAKQETFSFFCTTLTLSRHKNARLINQIGEELSQKYGVAWLPSEFRKQNGEKRTSEICAQFDIYRQNYCGCKFSMRQNARDTKFSQSN